MWRTFTNAAPTAREGQLDRFFLQKRHFICILSLKILKTGPKADKNTLKTLFFPTPLTIWLSLAWFVAQQIRRGLKRCATNQASPETLRNESGQTEFGLICCATNQASPDLLRNVSGEAWNVAQRFRPNSARWWQELEKQGFWTFFACFLPCMVHFVHLYAHNSDILKRNRTQPAFPGCGDHWYKSPPLHRGCHRQLNN